MILRNKTVKILRKWIWANNWTDTWKKLSTKIIRANSSIIKFASLLKISSKNLIGIKLLIKNQNEQIKALSVQMQMAQNVQLLDKTKTLIRNLNKKMIIQTNFKLRRKADALQDLSNPKICWFLMKLSINKNLSNLLKMICLSKMKTLNKH